MLLLTAIEAIALTALRLNKPWSPFIAGPIYAFAIVPLLMKSLMYNGIGMVNFVWDVFSSITMFLIGTLYFKEKVNNLQQIGVIISLVGLFLVSIDS